MAENRRRVATWMGVAPNALLSVFQIHSPDVILATEPFASPRPKADALLNLHRNSFNHHVHGRQGFETLADVVERCDVYDLHYSDLDEALACFARLSA